MLFLLISKKIICLFEIFFLQNQILIQSQDTEGGHFILYSPMDEIINLQASLHQTDVLQETIVWSSGDSPLVASYDHRKHQLSIWRVQPPREGREETIERKAASAFHAVSHVQTSETPRGASR